jgi:uncharacterized phage protein (TIGR01671 family)
MNKEIKFRAKHISTGEWVYGYYVEALIGVKNGDKITPQIFDEDGKTVHIIDKKTVGQYTGEDDINGINIYKGDILRGHEAGSGYDEDGNDDDDFTNDEGFITEVKFEDGAFVVDACTGDFDRTAIGWAKESGFSYNRIGNIYDNKDLIK